MGTQSKRTAPIRMTSSVLPIPARPTSPGVGRRDASSEALEPRGRCVAPRSFGEQELVQDICRSIFGSPNSSKLGRPQSCPYGNGPKTKQIDHSDKQLIE